MSTMVYAKYIRTTGQGSNWYEAPVSQMSADLLQYFQERASRVPDFCKIDDEKVRWCTMYEWADQLALSTFTSSAGKLCLKCDPILTVEQRREQAMNLKKENPTPTKVVKGASDIEVDDLDFS